MPADQEEELISALNRKLRFVRRATEESSARPPDGEARALGKLPDSVSLAGGAVGTFGDAAGNFLGFAEYPAAAVGDLWPAGPGDLGARVDRFLGDGVKRDGFGEQGGQAVHGPQVIPLADHGQAQPEGQGLAQVEQRQLDVLPGVLGLVLDADRAAGDACPGELAGELAALDDAVVPVDAAGCDYQRGCACVLPGGGYLRGGGLVRAEQNQRHRLAVRGDASMSTAAVSTVTRSGLSSSSLTCALGLGEGAEPAAGRTKGTAVAPATDGVFWTAQR